MIAPLTVAHLPAVLAIEQASAARPWPAERFRAELARRDRTYLVVHDGSSAGGPEGGGEVVGFGGIAMQADAAHVMTLAVASWARRRGHGTELVRRLLEAATDRGATGVTLEVRASNAAAQELYRRLGFRPAGVRPGYYPDGEDAVIMWWWPDGEVAADLVGDVVRR